jgi:enoyl-CoA hydratase/carnithine racemase
MGRSAALALGLVSRVVSASDLDQEVAAYASRLAAIPTAAVVATNELMRDALDLDEALRREGAARSPWPPGRA